MENHTVVDKLRDQCDHTRPPSYEEKWEYHFWRNTAMNTKEDWPFRVVIKVARPYLHTFRLRSFQHKKEPHKIIIEVLIAVSLLQWWLCGCAVCTIHSVR